MSALVLTLKEPPPQRCDLSPLAPGRLAADPGAIERLEIQTGSERLLLGDIFSVAPGDAADIVIEGGSERFDDLGADMAGGSIRVIGDLGQRAGRGMQGGAITVEGSVGRLAGSGMAGGRLTIAGDAGDLAGAPMPGEVRGMTGGAIHIRGKAGARAGDRMRRGLIAIDGSAGDHLASRMIGGTVVCLGAAGALPGMLMTRGTVVIGGGAGALLPTFVDTGAHQLVALRLLARWLADAGISATELLEAPLRRLLGDTATLGKGEVFVRH